MSQQLIIELKKLLESIKAFRPEIKKSIIDGNIKIIVRTTYGFSRGEVTHGEPNYDMSYLYVNIYIGDKYFDGAAYAGYRYNLYSKGIRSEKEVLNYLKRLALAETEDRVKRIKLINK